MINDVTVKIYETKKGNYGAIKFSKDAYALVSLEGDRFVLEEDPLNCGRIYFIPDAMHGIKLTSRNHTIQTMEQANLTKLNAFKNRDYELKYDRYSGYYSIDITASVVAETFSHCAKVPHPNYKSHTKQTEWINEETKPEEVPLAWNYQDSDPIGSAHIENTEKGLEVECHINEEHLQEVMDYCRNDALATKEVFDLYYGGSEMKEKEDLMIEKLAEIEDALCKGGNKFEEGKKDSGLLYLKIAKTLLEEALNEIEQ